MSSLAAWMVTPKMGVYSATKAFLEVYCDGLHLDLKSAGVAVTCIHPGFVKSEMTAKNKFKMPFLLEADDAAERMGRAILRRREELRLSLAHGPRHPRRPARARRGGRPGDGQGGRPPPSELIAAALT